MNLHPMLTDPDLCHLPYVLWCEPPADLVSIEWVYAR